MKTVVVIPAYNEQSRIGKVAREATAHADQVLVIDDGSDDRTAEAARAGGNGVAVLRHRINLGKGAALKTGCLAALRLGADIVVMMDGDGQHPPEYISRMTAAMMADDLDAVFCFRKGGDSMPLIRRTGNQLIRILAAVLFNIYLRDLWCGLRAVKAKTLSAVDWQASDYSGEVQMILRIGGRELKYREMEIPAIYNDRFKGVMILDGLKLLARMIIWRIRL